MPGWWLSFGVVWVLGFTVFTVVVVVRANRQSPADYLAWAARRGIDVDADWVPDVGAYVLVGASPMNRQRGALVADADRFFVGSRQAQLTVERLDEVVLREHRSLMYLKLTIDAPAGSLTVGAQWPGMPGEQLTGAIERMRNLGWQIERE